MTTLAYYWHRLTRQQQSFCYSCDRQLWRWETPKRHDH